MSNPQSNIVACMIFYKQKGDQLALSKYLIDADCGIVIEWMVQSSQYCDLFEVEKKVKKVRKQKQCEQLEVGCAYTLVVEDVQSSDSITVTVSGQPQKIYLASLQTPKCNTFGFEQYGFECRQFLRTFYNKEVDVKVEYKRELEMREGDTEQQTRTYASVYY